jgi:hypothetical protein
MHNSSLARFRWVMPLAIAGLATLSLPIQPSLARDNDYQTCAAALRDVGLSEAQVASACAAALRPADLATCVGYISDLEAIDAAAALSGCRRVRRPLEYATCVVDINNQGAVANDVLEQCRRSLLPARFSECVVGLVAEISASTGSAMESCIAATDPEQDQLPPAPATDPIEPEPALPVPTVPTVPSPVPSPAPSPAPL